MDSDTQALRAAMRSLVSGQEMAQARTAYYALEHPANRTQLTVLRNPEAEVIGYLAACTTGLNPFQPVVVFDAPTESQAELLCQRALIPGRNYLFLAPVKWSLFLEQRLGTLAGFSHLWRLEAAHFQPVVNVFVRTSSGADSAPRALIEAQGRTVAAAGVNWMGARYAELYLQIEAVARSREWARSVLAAVCSELLARGRTALYYLDAESADGLELHRALTATGFSDSGATALQIEGIWPGVGPKEVG